MGKHDADGYGSVGPGAAAAVGVAIAHCFNFAMLLIVHGGTTTAAAEGMSAASAVAFELWSLTTAARRLRGMAIGLDCTRIISRV
jgi:hypothetical protein